MAINNAPDIHNQILAANIFVRRDGKYLVLRRSPLKHYAPNVVHPVGGKVDANENPYQTAIREVYEETGVTVKNIRLEAIILEVEPVKDEPYNWMVFHFTGDYAGGDIKATEEGGLVWLTNTEIANQPLFPSVDPIIDQILDQQVGVVFATFEYNQEKTEIVRQDIKVGYR